MMLVGSIPSWTLWSISSIGRAKLSSRFTPFLTKRKEYNVYALAGFSDKIFDVMKMFDVDKKALVHEIEKIEL